MINYTQEQGLKRPKGLSSLLDFINAAGRGAEIDVQLINHNYIRTLKVTPNLSGERLQEFNDNVMELVHNTCTYEHIVEKTESGQDRYVTNDKSLLISMNAVELGKNGEYLGLQGDDALNKTIESIEQYNMDQHSFRMP
ncbi:MAG: hypothetical protein WBK77_10770 [Alphaproteobacteria bacterium]